MSAREVELLSEDGAKDYLRELINKLDSLDEEDFFGTEGWRHYLGLEE
jgi:hypothetical protein